MLKGTSKQRKSHDITHEEALLNFKALEIIEDIYWKNGGRCPHCKKQEYSFFAANQLKTRYECLSCKKTFFVTSKTVFNGIAMNYHHRFLLICLIVNSRKMPSYYSISQAFDIGRSGPSYICNEIRTALLTDEGEFLIKIAELFGSPESEKPNLSVLLSDMINKIEKY